MEQRKLSNELQQAARAVEIIWSTLEAVYDAMGEENAVADTYHAAIRGAADHAFRTKNCLSQMLVDMNK